MHKRSCSAGHRVYVDRCPSCNDQGSAIPDYMMTTLPSLPGHRIIKLHGLVTELAATSGFTAKSKGNDAMDDALQALRESAASLSANAIVGLITSTFAAGGGVTNVFGGDAVGVLLLGTAVTVETEQDHRSVLGNA